MKPDSITAKNYRYGSRAAIYCRLSKDDEQQGESASIQNQKDLLKNYCIERGWEIAGTFADASDIIGLNQKEPNSKGDAEFSPVFIFT